ncbi:MAG: hypothetical protein HY721_15225 [Planctomycetes bacterium]|nr:hypothetical protein [Planctomycetota bacterium]
MVLADLDEDGHADCATQDFGASSVSVLRGAGPATAAGFRRGDADLDGRSTLTDAVLVLRRLFLGGEALRCEDAADSDDDGALRLTDALFLLLHLFAGGAAPPEPGPARCGPDPTEDALARCAGACR